MPDDRGLPNTSEAMAEGVIIDLAEQIYQILALENITNIDFAERLGVTPDRVTKLLRGDGTLTLATVAKIAHLLGRSVSVRLARPQTRPAVR